MVTDPPALERKVVRLPDGRRLTFYPLPGQPVSVPESVPAPESVPESEASATPPPPAAAPTPPPALTPPPPPAAAPTPPSPTPAPKGLEP